MIHDDWYHKAANSHSPKIHPMRSNNNTLFWPINKQLKCAGHSLWGATWLRRPLCDPVSIVSCIKCTLSSVSRLPVSISASLKSVSGILELWLLGPGNQPIQLEPSAMPRPGGNPESPWKVINFKPVSRATKLVKIGPKATQNHEKNHAINIF